MRTEVIPEVLAGSDAAAHVGGQTAAADWQLHRTSVLGSRCHRSGRSRHPAACIPLQLEEQVVAEVAGQVDEHLAGVEAPAAVHHVERVGVSSGDDGLQR